MAKQKPKPKSKKTSNPLKLETKQQIKTRYERSPQAIKSYGMKSGSKPHTIQSNNPYTRPISGRSGVSDKVARAHEAVSKHKKKK